MTPPLTGTYDFDDEFEERAAIIEYEGGKSRPVAEALARAMIMAKANRRKDSDWDEIVHQGTTPESIMRATCAKVLNGGYEVDEEFRSALKVTQDTLVELDLAKHPVSLEVTCGKEGKISVRT